MLLFDSPFVGAGGCSASGAAWIVQLFAPLPCKGGILFSKRIPPLYPPEKDEGRSPRPPTLRAGSLKSCAACGIRCGVRGFATSLLRVGSCCNRALLRGARVTGVWRRTACASAALLRSPPVGEMMPIRGSICGGTGGIASLAAAVRILLTYRFLPLLVGRQ